MTIVGEMASSKKAGKRQSGFYVWAKCPQCGMERWVRRRFDGRVCKTCGTINGGKNATPNPNTKRHYGKDHPSWKGGRVIDAVGRILIKLNRYEFFYPMAQRNGYVLEHRLVMAKHLGRNLHSWEIVHHRNAIKNDNRIDNLQLVSNDRHNQITIMQQKIKKLETEIERLKQLIH